MCCGGRPRGKLHAWVCAHMPRYVRVELRGAPHMAHQLFSLIHGLRAAGCGEVCVPQLVVRLSRGVVWVRLS